MADAFSALARFVIRPHGEKSPQGDLLLGSMFKGAASPELKSGTIYELREILGVIVLVEVGPAAIGSSPKTSSIDVAWSATANHVIQSGHEWLLTKQEVETRRRNGYDADCAD